MNDIETIYDALPNDVKRKVSLHDLKRIHDALLVNPERKEPWASVILVATNRAVRKFQAEFPGHGTFSAVFGTKDGDLWYWIRVGSLLTDDRRDYPLRDLGFEPADIEPL